MGLDKERVEQIELLLEEMKQEFDERYRQIRQLLHPSEGQKASWEYRDDDDIDLDLLAHIEEIFGDD